MPILFDKNTTKLEPEFITYKRFNDPALAEELTGLLDGNGIDYTIEEESSGFDPSMVMSNAPIDYAVKIKSEDFELANQLLKEYEEKNTEGIDKDYYLYSFADDELMDVIIKTDEWNPFDCVLARKILSERGKNISDEEIFAINKKRIEKLQAPAASQTFWISAGYLLALGGGVLGFFIGWHLSTYKKTLPDGEMVYGYIDSDRAHGKRIFYLSFVGLTIAFIYKLAPFFD